MPPFCYRKLFALIAVFVAVLGTAAAFSVSRLPFTSTNNKIVDSSISSSSSSSSRGHRHGRGNTILAFPLPASHGDDEAFHPPADPVYKADAANSSP
ncbi:unnamed protein product [Vitrella brassicaformis CCMP3155]|uniref:RxLR effector protein n=1 Tax=Vitrella brassicaformis (strain CCMP3155) TaxID=1169540 RepID=A0A0G4GLF7_VITBC|nr:unnamed protein product [Vitrella brassicaformis CCMP3155]|mmetsp:Transcript_33007/g.81744  ORF Transcript_33007/g.81744 Transcript_33007/m.81744 type:complete len:97 (+) Transcript_33007:101-391(+)|eukprot:CEM30949.1 unnamed protein product [Vitrella brassicaformis CCMP3155]